MSTDFDKQVRQMQQAARNDPKEEPDRDPEDIKIADSPEEKVLKRVVGSFEDPKRCYCCSSPATVTLSLRDECFAACEICSVWLEACWTHMAAMATRYHAQQRRKEV